MVHDSSQDVARTTAALAEAQAPPATQAMLMNESRTAVAGLLQLHAIQCGADFAQAADLALATISAHAGEIRSWPSFQAMAAEIRLAVGQAEDPSA